MVDADDGKEVTADHGQDEEHQSQYHNDLTIHWRHEEQQGEQS